jgi:malate dehydrogenase
VPVKLGSKGVEQVVELKLEPDELAALKSSADHVRSEAAKLTPLGILPG